MQQIIVSQPGRPDALELVDRPRPTPQAGQALVRVHAAGVNYADVLQRRGTYPAPLAFPFSPGGEIAGVVEEVGADGTVRVGDRVLALVPQGGYSAYVAIPSASTFPLPDDVSFSQGAALLVQGLTAASVVEVAAAERNQRVFVSAAGGGVGTLLVQLLAARGVRVVAGVSHADKEALVRSLGAHDVARYDRPEWAEDLRAVVGELDLVIDSVGGEVYRGAMSLLATRGTAVIYGASSGDLVGVPPELAGPLIFKNQRVVGLALPLLMSDAAWTSRTLAALFEAVQKGQLRVILHPPFALADASAAHAAIEARATQGKVVLIPAGAAQEAS